MPPSPRRSPLARAARLLGRVLIGLVALLAVGAAVAYELSERALRRTVAVPVHAPPNPDALAPTPAAQAALVARGAHVAVTRGCTECHGAGLGGNVLVDDALVGRLATPNLTAGGRGPALDDRAWELALRHGVRPDGTPLRVMPSTELAGMSDEDVAAVAAYARSLPAVRTAPPAMRVGPLLRVFYLAGRFNLAPAQQIAQRTAHASPPAPGPTAAYGAYVATSCTGCHQANFAGGPIPGAPPGQKPAANLTPDPTTGLGRWSAADFDRLLTTGMRPDGHTVDVTSMPVKMTAAMSPVERQALWAYLRTVPARRTPAQGS